jgi:hypothetical protein
MEQLFLTNFEKKGKRMENNSQRNRDAVLFIQESGLYLPIYL